MGVNSTFGLQRPILLSTYCEINLSGGCNGSSGRASVFEAYDSRAFRSVQARRCSGSERNPHFLFGSNAFLYLERMFSCFFVLFGYFFLGGGGGKDKCCLGAQKGVNLWTTGAGPS